MIFFNRNKFFNYYLPMFLSVILIAGAGFFWYIHPARASYTYSRTVSIVHGQVGNGTEDEPFFTVLVCANATMGNGNACPTVAGLNQTGGGAHVQNLNGNDIVFSTVSDCSSGLLKWEMEKYIASSGEMEAWVLLTSVSHTSDTSFYMCYGNLGISTFQGGSVGSNWDTYSKGVWHFPDGSSLSGADSTTGNHTMASTNASAGAGQVDGAVSVSGSDPSYEKITASPTSGFPTTQEAWVKLAATGQSAAVVVSEIQLSSLEAFYFDWGVNLTSRAGCSLAMFAQDSTTAGTRASCYVTSQDTNWHHVVAEWIDANTQNLYVDGNLVGTTFVTVGSAPTPAAMDTTFVGETLYNTSSVYGPLNGQIDEVRISNYTRSAGWVKTEYNNESAPSTFENFGDETNLGGGGSGASTPAHESVRGGGAAIPAFKVRGGLKFR